MMTEPHAEGNMLTEEITIRVDVDAAKAYRQASEQDRRKLDLLLSLRLHDAMQSTRSLKEVIDDISAKARERGLTPEILESILRDS
jgi:hypothetical protein